MRSCRDSLPENAIGPSDGESGSAVVEFTFLALLLMVPVVYFVVTMGQIQAGSFAVVGAADQAAKVFVAQTEPGAGRMAAEQSAVMALKDHGFSPDMASIEIACDPADCSSPGARVTAVVRLAVPLPMVPFGDSLRLDAARLSASAMQVQGRFH